MKRHLGHVDIYSKFWVRRDLESVCSGFKGQPSCFAYTCITIAFHRYIQSLQLTTGKDSLYSSMVTFLAN